MIQSKNRLLVWKYFHNKCQCLLTRDPIFHTKLDLIKGFCRPGFRVLDAGFGIGSYATCLNQEPTLICGYDLTLEMLQYFTKHDIQSPHPTIRLVNGDLTAIAIKNKKFDLLYSYSTLYYIDHIETALAEFHRVLKNNGIAILEFGNKNAINALHSGRRYDCPHFFLSLTQIRHLLHKAGYEILQWRFFYLIPSFLHRGIFSRLLTYSFRGKTLDETVSSMRFLKSFSAKVLIIARKPS